MSFEPSFEIFCVKVNILKRTAVNVLMVLTIFSQWPINLSGWPLKWLAKSLHKNVTILERLIGKKTSSYISKEKRKKLIS
jgi:hypothetical protein